jgi:hypothetical protein
MNKRNDAGKGSKPKGCGGALALLERNRTQLLSLAERLFESETLSDSEIRSLLGFQSPTLAAAG